METIYVLFETDAWHSKLSRRFLGIFTDEITLVNTLESSLDAEYNLSECDRNMLLNSHQTQGRDVNYLIESCNVNPPQL